MSVERVPERVPVRELQHNSRAVLDRVTAGESLEITRDGEPIARLVPIDPVERTVSKLIAKGTVDADWLDQQAQLLQWLSDEPPVPAKRGGPALSEALLAMRDEEKA